MSRRCGSDAGSTVNKAACVEFVIGAVEGREIGCPLTLILKFYVSENFTIVTGRSRFIFLTY